MSVATGDDNMDFREYLDGVTPLEQDRVIPARQGPSSSPARYASNPAERFEAVDFSDRPDSYHAGGLQNGVLRRLRRGDIRPAALIDLHGYRRDRAQRMLESFIVRAATHGEKCVLVIHGKGSRSESRTAVLQQMVRAALARHPLVLAYCPATIRDGGDGAAYAYLKSVTNPSRTPGR